MKGGNITRQTIEAMSIYGSDFQRMIDTYPTITDDDVKD